uniref:Guanine nucleotide-binding protein alpha-1 subunit n=1 Tax=Hirondellea gigas TaxID=1518452 RepID=A0A6A7G6F3_9CRUS
MGVCSSSRGQPSADKQIGRALASRRREENKTLKLLLLGAGESGKSTLFKQTIQLYGDGFSTEELTGYTHIVYNNTISAMKTLIEESFNLFEVTGDSEYQISPRCERHTKRIIGCEFDVEIDPELADTIQTLWQDPGISRTFNERAKFQLSDGAKYYFDRITHIGEPGYIPDTEDILRCRVRTTGIVETSFVIEHVNFKMFDVGGQRNERRKWIHCFEKVTAVIFVAALSVYDQVLYEDDTINRMSEALQLFAEICNSRWFLDTSMILFLNKKDLFVQKIEDVPLSVCFPEYTGSSSFAESSEYIQEQFEAQNKSKKEVYPHITCATDKQNVLHVFNAAMDIVLRESLTDVGLF